MFDFLFDEKCPIERTLSELWVCGCQWCLETVTVTKKQKLIEARKLLSREIVSLPEKTKISEISTQATSGQHLSI